MPVPSDPDLAALMQRLPVLHRYERLVRTRLHPFAIRYPGTYGEALFRIVSYFYDNVAHGVSPINRAFLKRMVLFADQVIDGRPPEQAAELACEEHPDPIGREEHS